MSNIFGNEVFINNLEYFNLNINEEKVKFFNIDATKMYKYVDYYSINGINKDFTHIYSYNKMFEDTSIRSIATILNRTKFKILVWSFDENTSFNYYGLKDCILIDKLIMKSSSGSHNCKLFIYLKK